MTQVVNIIRFNNIKRTRQIIHIFAKHGFGTLADRLGIYKFLAKNAKETYLNGEIEIDNKKRSIGERLRLSFEELGPTFVKLGQIISTRPDMLPPEVISELEKLQDSVSPIPYEDVRTLIESELHDKIENVAMSFTQ